MPCYFFNVKGDGSSPDKEGTVLANPEAARSVAVVAAGEMLRDDSGTFWNGPDWRMHVTDEQGATVCTLTIKGSTGES